ncbi:MAG: tRNA (guanosine(46)-N7)-methyltransferase TrmB [Planctomycetaceae bacterium]|nr:tRNA (guanosine(46)-N7)-methyltransferase TrmB [Planctomycetaceae bacterium]
MQLNPPSVDLRPWFLTLNDIEGPIDWSTFFGNDNPVEIDVGCGRGLFVVSSSVSRPDINVLGIELDYREGRRGARRLKKLEAKNARILGGDVQQTFERLIVPQSDAGIHAYFPEPWWKKKHRRRRVFTDVLVNQMARLLVPRGFVHSWTDVEEYFGVISALMNHDDRFENLPPPDEHQPEHDMDYQTSFERKKRKLGCPIYRGRWQLR